MLTTQPIIPSQQERIYKFLFTQDPVAPQDFTASASTQTFTPLWLPADWLVTSVRVKNLVQFAGIGFTSVTVQIGAGGSAYNYYAAPFELTGPVIPTSQYTTNCYRSYTSASHAITVHFIASGTGVQIKNLTAGQVEITIGMKPF